MKKNLIIILAGTISFCSCTTVNKKDIFSVAENLEKSLMKNNVKKLKSLFEYNMDSINQSSKEEIEEIKEFYSKNNYKRIEIDTSNILNIWKFCEISYLVNNTYFQINFVYEKDKLGDFYIQQVFFININDACKRAEMQPYCPKKLIDFKNIVWYTDYYGTSFKSGSIELQNNTDTDIDYIKFRVILAKGGNPYFLSETFFNQTVESNNKIFQGDITTINIPGLENFYTGFKIEKDNLQFKAELIEIKPKPISNWCLKIEHLDNKVKTMLTK